MPRTCPKCGRVNRDDTDVCTKSGCNEWLGEAMVEESIGTPKTEHDSDLTPVGDTDAALRIESDRGSGQTTAPNALARYRGAVESYCLDGILDEQEREDLRHMRKKWSIPSHDAELIEQEVQHHFRKRVRALVRRDTLSHQPVNKRRLPIFDIINVDGTEYYQEVQCQLVIKQLGYDETVPLSHFILNSRRSPELKEFWPREEAMLDAVLRITLKPPLGHPIVLRSRPRGLQYEVGAPTTTGGRMEVHQHFQAGGDLRVVDASIRDDRIDASICTGNGFTAPDRSSSPDEWLEVPLEYDREMMEDLAGVGQRVGGTKTTRRPAQYRSGVLQVQGPGGNRDIAVIASAVVTMGRNRTHSPDERCPREKLNDIQLELRSENPSPLPHSGDPAVNDRREKYRAAIRDAIAKPDRDWPATMGTLAHCWQRLGLVKEEAEALEREIIGRTCQEAIDTRRITGHAHLVLRCLGQEAVLIDQSTHGTVIKKTNLQRDQIKLDDQTDVKVAGVLDLMVELFRSSAVPGAVSLSFQEIQGLPADVVSARLVGFDKDGELDAVRIRQRRGRDKDPEHLVLIREAKIGSSPYDAIQLRDSGVRERHARLLVDKYQGQFWIECLAENETVSVNGTAYRRGQRIGLVSGDVIGLGSTQIQFVADADRMAERFEAWFPMTTAEARGVQDAAARHLEIPVARAVDIGKGVKLHLVLIPAGEYSTSSPNSDGGWSNSGSRRTLRIAEPFYLGKYEVTQKQWQAVMGGSNTDSAREDYPVEAVSWGDCRKFCERLSKRISRTVRLPTEAEWEYACRAGTKTAYSFGDLAADLEKCGWCASNSDGRTSQVGQKEPNGWGLHDMHGNVWEWCDDLLDPPGSGSSSDERRVLRGGCYFDPPEACRSATRRGDHPSSLSSFNGFRVVVPCSNR